MVSIVKKTSGVSAPDRLRWLLLRARGRIRSTLMRALLRDADGSPEEAWIIAGTARSGTTWLAEAIEHAQPARMMFEPFHSGKIEELNGMPLFPYLVPGQRHERLESYARSVLSGTVRHPWIDRHLLTAKTERRLIKEIRANLFLRWLHELFPRVPILFLIRHPCAVVSSRLRGGWSADEDLEDMLAQPALVRDHLAEYLDFLRDLGSEEQRHAAVWCIHNLVPLSQFQGEGLRLVAYEHLVRNTETEIRKIFEHFAPATLRTSLQGLRSVSATAGPDSSVIRGQDPILRWQQDLATAQVEDILATVRIFGLDHLYSAEPMPLADGLERYGVAKR